ncbi:MAG: sugar phosphate nucleotidyltransferase [Candidatus Woesebacteria bacterium]|nr:sugar phosphate nucleotidyltransferase [Candidatus Woesebacteria bacterium]
MGNLNIIILAGGESSRFWPLQEKNSYPFLGITNINKHIARFKKIGNCNFIVVTNGNLIIENKDINVVTQTGSGMAGAVMSALEEINQDEEILVLNANDYYDEGLISDFIKIREELNSTNSAMLVGYKTEKYFPGGYLKIENGNITGIIEKPGEGNTPSEFVNIVFHYFNNANELLNSLLKSRSKNDDVYEVALDSLMKSSKVFKLLEYKGQWKTIKYPWHVLDVMEYFLDTIKGQNISTRAEISKNAFIKGNVIIEDGVKIFEGAVVNGPCYIGKNTIIANGALVRNSIIGENCVIGYATEIARSYFKDNVWLHKNYVGDSIFESNVSLGSNAITGNLRLDEQNITKSIKGNKIGTDRNKLGAIIGSNVRIGINVNMMPGISIGSNSFVGPNVNVEKDIEDNKFLKLVQSIEIKENRFDIKSTSREKIKKKIK